MTVLNTSSRNQYIATASQTVFTCTFEIFDKDDIAVDQDGIILSEGTHYTVSGVGDNAGGDVTLTTGAASGDVITLYRAMALERLTDYQNSGDFLADEVNEDFDRVWLALQQNLSTANIGIRPSINDPVLNSANTELASVSARGGKVLGFAADGTIDYISATIAGGAFNDTSTTSAMTALSGLSVGDVVQTAEFSTGNGGGGVYDVVLTSSVATNGMNIIEGVADVLISFVLRSPLLVADQFGAKEGASFDNSPMLQAMINTGKKVLLTSGKTYYAKNLTSIAGGGLLSVGGRATIRVIDGAGEKGIVIDDSDFELDGINFDGGNTGPWNDDITPAADRVGVTIGNTLGTGLQLNGITFKNSDVYGFDLAGVQGKEVQVGFLFGKRVVYENVSCRGNYLNWAIGTNHEYCTFSQCYGYEGREGVQMTGGNNSFVACHFEWNYINCNLSGGSNNAHGQFIGCSFNHSAPATAGNLGLFCKDITNGHVFLGCAFWFSPIKIDNSQGIMISKSQVAVSAVTIDGGGVNHVDDNYTHLTPLSITLVGFTFTTFRRNRMAVAAATSQEPSYGDYFVSADESTLAYPIAWNAATDFVVTFTNMIKKYNSVTQSFVHSDSLGSISVSGNYQFDMLVVFSTAAAQEQGVLKLRTFRSAVALKEYIVSGVFPASTSECALKLSQQVFLTTGDTYDITFKSVGGTVLTIASGGLDFTVKSLDN